LSVNKKDISNIISERLSLSKKDSLYIVQNFFKAITENKTYIINISNFGTFKYKETPKRIGRNPKTLEHFEIKSRTRLVFKPSDKIKQTIN